MDCFNRLWPIVPEKLKITIRTTIRGRLAGLSPAAVVAEVAREVARWRETVAPQIAAKSAPQARSAKPATSGVRVRMLFRML
jgi:hypothetical protein